MNIGNQILNIRKENQLTQEEFGNFAISLDTLLKEDSKMIQSMDKERAMGIIKHEKSKSDKKAVQYIKERD